ncbi:transposase [Xenorhabdus bovienii]|uniref:Transposase n=1 Tax=Xenorhabdus bovienii TaxID=40576 RepID=A0AAJ1J846_XENBV|nr:transposase [Xenorhabdus bovienii]MDE1475615.1 transposase [Xenorhabdus bovienii]MDE1477108.1 transposase [Xenorhabdus bovienii]MDE1488051.1 transposase [Xenorhabdus bovienii]MDE1489379.1 transposase [Xenorhabdus bovienii]MDE1495396.1 transposase [Xenorhabdus bovienii]
MQLKQPRCQYSAEFKLEAAQQVILHQQSVVDVARSLGIDPTVVSSAAILANGTTNRICTIAHFVVTYLQY